MGSRIQQLKAFKRLLDIMDELREKCPWDRKQTFETLRHLTIEETYELGDAILDNDLEDVKKELGDFSEKLLEKEFYIVVTKVDLIDEETRFETVNTFNAREFTNVFSISSVTGEGVQELLDDISRKIFI